MPSTEHELLAAWAAGEQDAANLLFGRYYRSVLRFFDLRVGPEAEDLTQRTFLACIEARHTLRSRDRFKAFLFGIARNQLLRYLREKTRHARAPEFSAGSAVPGITASRLVAIGQEQQMLLRAMQELPIDNQMLIELFYWEELKVGEIAEILEITVTTVTTRLGRARDALRASIERLVGSARARDALLTNLDHWVVSIRDLPVTGAENVAWRDAR